MELINNDVRYESCPLCQSNSIIFQGTIHPNIPAYYSTTKIKLSKLSELWLCKNCKSSFVQNSVSQVDSVRLYTQGDSEKVWTKQSFEESRTQPTISKIKKFLSPGAKILDVGCGSGNFLDFAKSQGCITSGVEYSASSLEEIIKNGHLGFSNLDRVSGTFDIITAFDVIEHLYDVPGFIKKCRANLTQDGYIIILTGDISCRQSKIAKANWWYVRFPEHIIFPSLKYYINYSGLLLIDWFRTYHSPNAQFKFITTITRIFLKLIQKKIYDGHPPLSHDHCLIILSNKI
jgi:cyclopropane fatty-acyl-phospholipid synthase-like methyltransferase